MENFDNTLFLMLNASGHPDKLPLAIATFFGVYAVWVIPAILGIGWLNSRNSTRKLLLEAVMSGLAGLLLNQIIALVLPHARPLALGLGHTLISHAADSSFPSDHLTLLWAVAVSFLLHRRLRKIGLALAFLGLPVAWARIYLGVHFPLDMVGAAFVALLSALLAYLERHLYIPAIYSLVVRVYRTLFKRLIQMGWARN